jgi:hypothetical protein
MNSLIPLYQKLILVLTQLRNKMIAMETESVPPVVSTPTVPAPVSKIHIWALAVAVQEGAKKSLNNPGNLKYSTLTASWGATKGFQATDGGWIAQFPTPQAGETALENFLTLGCQDELVAFHAPEARTLGGFTQIYAGNPPPEYEEAVGRALGCPLDTPISSFLS